MPVLGERKSLGQTKKKTNEPIDKKERKIDIPKDFIRKIKNLEGEVSFSNRQ